MDNIIVIGYSGHSYVVIDAIYSNGGTIKGYCDRGEKSVNPFDLKYLGEESIELLSDSKWIVCIGDNKLREKIHIRFNNVNKPITVIHPNSVISSKCSIGHGVFIAPNATVNPFANIGNGVIINTGAIVEHECKVEDFVHLAPGAVLAGNVSIGKNTFVGANSVVKQAVQIGKNVTIGAGSVIVQNIPDNEVVVGNPGKPLYPN